MGFLKRILRDGTESPEALDTAPAVARQPYDVPSAGSWNIAGVSHHIENLRRVFEDPPSNGDSLSTDAVASLEREPTNRYDPNAVAVKVQGLLVGYIPAEQALAWNKYVAALQDRALQPQATVTAWRSWDRREYESPLYYVSIHARENADYRLPEEIAASGGILTLAPGTPEAERQEKRYQKFQEREQKKADKQRRAEERADG